MMSVRLANVVWLLALTMSGVTAVRAEDQVPPTAPVLPPGCTEVIDVATLHAKGGDLRIVRSKPPRYPKDALDRELEGVVELEVVVGHDGKIVAVTVVSSTYRWFIEPAVLVMKDWEYTPPIADGHPTCVRTTVTHRFRFGYAPG